MSRNRKDRETTPAGIAGGQGKSPEQVESSTLCAAWALLGFLVILGGLLLYRFIAGIVARIGGA